MLLNCEDNRVADLVFCCITSGKIQMYQNAESNKPFSSGVDIINLSCVIIKFLIN